MHNFQALKKEIGMTKQQKKLAELGITQLTLPQMPPEPPKNNRKPTLSIFYYIVRKLDQEMLITIDQYGNPVWGVHDLRTTKPHLYNRIATAQVDCHDYNGGRILRYPYTVR